MEQDISLRFFLDDGTVLEWRLLNRVPRMLNHGRIRGHEARLILDVGGIPNDYLVELDTTDWDMELGDIQDVGACPAFPSLRAALEATNALRDVLVDRFPGVPLKVTTVFPGESVAIDPNSVGVMRYEMLSTRAAQDMKGPRKRVHPTDALSAHIPKQRHFMPSQKMTAKYSGRCSECRESFQAGTDIYYSRPEGACCLACGKADVKELTDEDYERQAREEWDAWHEEGYTTAYCPDCDMTYEFHWVAQLGARSSAPIKCPNCLKELGGLIEDDATVNCQRKGKP